MVLKWSKQSLYSLLFIACIGVPILNIYELTFAVWVVSLLVTIQRKYSTIILKIIAPFIAILTIGCISSLWHSYSVYNYIRDITYLLKPIVGLLLGYQLLRKTSSRAMLTIIMAGVFLATCHLVIVGVTFVRFQTISVNLLRNYCGYFSDYEIYVLIILIFYKKFDIQLSQNKVRLYALILMVSSLFYLSRTNFIQFVVLFLAVRGSFVLSLRSIKIVGTAIIIAGLSYSAVYIYNPKRGGKGIEAFLYKIKIAPTEPFKMKINQSDWKEFNDNYRSFENITTVKQVSGSDDIIAGKGVGSTIDLGREMWSNDGEFIRYIPILHNAFATVFLKSGLLGVFFLVLSMIIISRSVYAPDEKIKYINYLLLGTGIFLIVSNWVFMGLYLKLDNKSILIGYLICYRELLVKKHQNSSQSVQE